MPRIDFLNKIKPGTGNDISREKCQLKNTVFCQSDPKILFAFFAYRYNHGHKHL